MSARTRALREAVAALYRAEKTQEKMDARELIWDEIDALEVNFKRYLKAIDTACRIIEVGDDRLLASDGVPGGQPPDLSLREWSELYGTLSAARDGKVSNA